MVGGWGRVLQGGQLWSVTIVSIQGHRLERLLVEPAAGAVRRIMSLERASVNRLVAVHGDVSLMSSNLGSHGGRDGILAVMLRAWVV